MNPTRYPLAWPVGWRRTAPGQRRQGKFHTGRYGKPLTITEAADRLAMELKRHGGEWWISTDIQTRNDGMPRANQPAPADPGAAAYWNAGDGMKCLAIDAYTTVAQNIAALAATLDAMRAIERHGGAEIMARTFSGFAALPEQSTAKTWAFVMDLPTTATRAQIDARYRELAKTRHPDRQPNRDLWDELQTAYQQAQATRPL